MRRILPAAALLLAIYGFLNRPLSAQDQVFYRSPTLAPNAKDLLIDGKIKLETPSGVTVTVGKEDRMVPASEIVQLAYRTKDKSPADFRGPDGNMITALKADPKTKSKERRDLFTKALNDLSELAPKVTDHPFASRYVQYRIAEIKYRMAMDDGQKAQAIKALEEYTAAHPEGWEIVASLKTLARLHEEGNDLANALSALERLADLKDAPKDIKREGNIAVSQMLMRAKRYPDAEKRLTALLDTLPQGDPQRAATQVYLVQSQVAQKKTDGAEKHLTEAIRGTSDPLLRGMAYNGLGDYYREKGQPEEAFWAYLRVDTMYNLDAQEHAKAIYHLSELFKTKKFGDRTGDPARAKNYRERLQDKRFAETEYPKLVPTEP